MKMYNIGIIDKINSKGLEIFKQKSNFKFEVITDLSKKNLLKKLPRFDGITLRRGKINSELLSKCKKLKVISNIRFLNEWVKFIFDKKK